VVTNTSRIDADVVACVEDDEDDEDDEDESEGGGEGITCVQFLYTNFLIPSTR